MSILSFAKLLSFQVPAKSLRFRRLELPNVLVWSLNMAAPSSLGKFSALKGAVRLRNTLSFINHGRITKGIKDSISTPNSLGQACAPLHRRVDAYQLLNVVDFQIKRVKKCLISFFTLLKHLCGLSAFRVNCLFRTLNRPPVLLPLSSREEPITKMPSRILPTESSDAKPLIAEPLSSFTRLSPKVSIYTPPSTIKGSPLDPTTILLCSWMNAAPKHIEYYVRIYQKIFPGARIILSTMNTKTFLFQSEAKRRADVKEAVSALLAPDQGNERLFVHAFSNGGAKRMYAVAGAYQASTGKALPARAFLLDSAPGIPKFRRDIHALTVPVQKWPLYLWLPYMAVTIGIASAVYVLVNWLPEWVWRDLVWSPMYGTNDFKFVPKDCVRGYIYSKEDLAMDWKDVERHAAVAESKGYTVVKKLVEGAEHVQLFKGKGGEKGYWDFVQKVWALGVGGQ